MRYHGQLATAIACIAIVCFAWTSPGIDHGSPSAKANTAHEATGWPKIPSQLPPAEVYRQVKSIAEEFLRPLWPRPADVWHRPWNTEQAFREFRGFEERLRSLENASGRLPPVNFGRTSRMFAPWQRLKVEGVETGSETDAAAAPRGGPEDEVILATGELVLTHTDVSLPERGGVGVSLVRYYRSHVDYDGPLGPGWDHSCNQRIVAEGRQQPPANLVWYTGQRAIRFTRQGDRWEPEAGAYYRLEIPDNRIVIETPDRIRFEFEPAQARGMGAARWRIARISGRHDQWRANQVNFRYWPGSDVLQQVEDAYGNSVRFHHDVEGRLAAVECHDLVVLYRYDEHDRLAQVTVPRVAVRLAHAEDATWQYSYFTGLNGRSWLGGVIPPGETVEKRFDHQMAADRPGYGRVITASLSSRKAKAPEKAVWRFAAQQAARRCVVTYQPPPPLPQEEWTFPRDAGRVGCYPLARRIPAHNAEWKWKHNAAGQLLEQRAPVGGVTRWRYDSEHADPRFRGNLLEKEELARPGRNPLGFVKRGWRWTYHPQIALPVKAVAFEVLPDGSERVLEESAFEYDQQNLDLVREQTGERVTQIVRNRFGLPVVQWDGRGCATVFHYYANYNAGRISGRNGGLVAEVVRDASPAAVAVALQSVGFRAKDGSVPVRQAEGEPCHRLAQFRYDDLGRTIWESYPGYRIARLWNKLGQTLALLDSRTDLVVYDYDAAFRRTGQWRRIERLRGAPYLGETRPDAQGYFAAQRLRYDALGRLVAWNPTLEKLGGDGPPEVRYEYYPSGQLKKRITPAGTAIEILYDQVTGRQKEIRLVANGNSRNALTLREDMAYDAEGFLVSYRDARGEIHQVEPDAFGRVLATRRPEDDLRRETLRDGLDRIVHERVFDAQGRLLDERRFEYDTTGRLVKVLQHRLGTAPDGTGQPKPIDQWLVAEENRYDPVGNVLARRGWREHAWHTFRYDGLGRLVSKDSPNGDRWQAYYDGDWLCVETQQLRTTGERVQAPTVYTLHTVTLRDERGQPWCVVPVGWDGTVGIRRAELSHFDAEGHLAFTLTPAATKRFRFFNTLGLVEREQVFSAPRDQFLTQTTNRYAADGLLLQREIYNRPLVFQPHDAAGRTVNFERRNVPQVRTFEYDEFRRLHREIAPDGLVQEYAYGPDSRVDTLARYPLNKPEAKQVIGFDYDRLGRLKSLEDRSHPQQPRTIQEFAYDWQDNVVSASDFAQPAHPLTVRRQYDNLGQLLWEKIELPNDGLRDVGIAYEYDLAAGKQIADLTGLEGRRAGWRKLTVQQDSAGRVQSITKDGEKLCEFAFVGPHQIAKRLPTVGLVEQYTRLDPFLETLEQRLTPEANPDSPVYRMHYLRDDLSRIVASSITVPSKRWECSKLYDRDAWQNLAAEDTLGTFLEPEALQKKRHALFPVRPRPNAPVDISTYHVRHYEYDEAGNLVALYRGRPGGRWPKGAVLVSSWNPLAADAQVAARQTASFRFASLAHTKSFRRNATDGVPSEAAESQALASNRPAAKAIVTDKLGRVAQLIASYKYDPFGRLQNYVSDATGRSIRWDVEYDVLGRVIAMRGIAADPTQRPTPTTAAESSGGDGRSADTDGRRPVCELRFAYDPFNRRIVKEVVKNPLQESRTERPALYVVLHGGGQRPLVKLRKADDPKKPWIIKGQYIWGAGPSQVLAYYERRYFRSSTGHGTAIILEHLLHQDAALNVVLSTRPSLEQPKEIDVYDVASYWGLGENSTTGVVENVTSSLRQEQGHQASWAIDRTLDSRSAAWFGDNRAGYLALRLAKKQRLSRMEVSADRFPQHFRVYVVEGEGPEKKFLTSWEKRHSEDKVWETPRHRDDLSEPDATRPRTVPLGGREGQVIVLVWDSCPGGIQVREFEVVVQPLYPGDLAFSGTIYDAETGLYYHGARYRLPELGTFISPDPLGFLGGDNLYAFAHNDPLTWHDPDGRLAHVLIGAGAGAAFGAGTYVFEWWYYGEDWDWARFGIYTAAGAASGALAAATAGASLAVTAGYGVSATSSALIAGAVSGGVGGAVHGAIQAGGITYLETGDLSASLHAAGTSALVRGGFGVLGGTVSGAVISQLGGSLFGFVASGAAGGATVGAVAGGYQGYRSTGTLAGLARGSLRGAVQGGIVGGAIGGAAWVAGRIGGLIRPLPKQPEGLPDPRTKGILIRTEAKRGNYGGVPVKPGYARHHIKPLSLGGTDTPDNIVEIPIDVHRQPHPGPEVTNAPPGTIFY